MNDKQKEIEEMAKALDAIEAIMWENAAYDTSDMAKSFYDAGYRNIKDKVVLSKEEYQNDFSSQFNKGYEKGSKETAREIIEYLRDNGRKYEVWYLISELAKQYGVKE